MYLYENFINYSHDNTTQHFILTQVMFSLNIPNKTILLPINYVNDDSEMTRFLWVKSIIIILITL